jgi:nucleoside-diphosphate-sugar epimerase
MTEKVLIAGGSGFIGSSLIEKLLELKYQVFCIDRNINSFSKNKSIILIKSDILKINVKKISNNFSYIYDFAADLGVNNAIKNSDKLLINNILATSKIIQIAKKQKKLKRIFFSSTSEIYDHSSGFEESDIITSAPLNHPRSSYWISKYAGEFLIAQSNLPYTIFRIFNAYGKNMKKNVFYDIKKKLKKGKATFENPNHIRSFIYIDDLIKLIIFSKKKIFENEIINLGNPENPIKIRSLINTIIKKYKFSGKYKFKNISNNSTKYRRPNIKKFIRLNKEKIKFKSLIEGINEIFN